MDSEWLRGAWQTKVQSNGRNGGVQLLHYAEGLGVDRLLEIAKQLRHRWERWAGHERPHEQIAFVTGEGHLTNRLSLTIDKQKHLSDVSLHA
jgi:hypothetical protein